MEVTASQHHTYFSLGDIGLHYREDAAATGQCLCSIRLSMRGRLIKDSLETSDLGGQLVVRCFPCLPGNYCYCYYQRPLGDAVLLSSHRLHKIPFVFLYISC